MKLLFLVAITAVLATAESHPSWWTYASPEATALVGIQWNNLRHSPLGPAIEAQLSPDGAFAFPDLDCLRQAREIVISSPALLAAEAGNFPAAVVRDQAQRDGLLRTSYRGVTLWLPDQASKLGVAQISEQLVLVGNRKTLQAAIDRSLSQSGRLYSPLLPRAARFSQTGDLWVVTVKLPDPLAGLFVPGLFVPMDADALEFLGQISVRDGITMEASFDAGSDEAAADFARGLRERAPSFSALAQGLEATADRSKVTLALRVSREELATNLHPTVPPTAPAAPVPQPLVTAAVVPAPNSIAPAPVEIAAMTQPDIPPVPAPEPVMFTVIHTEASVPQIVRIFGLDEGVKEIVLPPY